MEELFIGHAGLFGNAVDEFDHFLWTPLDTD
jgi:hypothetical protein